jgi:hypothetical protein
VYPKPHWVKEIGAYTIPFFFADPSVVRLSQQLVLQDRDLHQQSVESPPVQFSAYICIPTFKALAMGILASTVFGFLARFRWGQRLLLRHPRFFTLGLFSHQGPSQQQLAETSFSETFFARGFSKALRDRHTKEGELREVQPDVLIVTNVSGPEPGMLC